MTSSCATPCPRTAGDVVDHTGDGFFLRSPVAEDAVAAAVAIQRAAAEAHLPFDLRIGDPHATR